MTMMHQFQPFTALVHLKMLPRAPRTYLRTVTPSSIVPYIVMLPEPALP